MENPGTITDESTASNNWVIHGNYTSSGRPLLSSDPHLSNGLPSNWYLMSLQYSDKYTSGSTYPGIPGVLIGRAKHFAWGMTAVLADVSDLFKEQLNKDGTAYKVDGQWKQIKIVEEKIKVKDKTEPVIHKVRLTHRGPIVD